MKTRNNREQVMKAINETTIQANVEKVNKSIK